jgi:putative ABC transport system ATP-binding protein
MMLSGLNLSLAFGATVALANASATVDQGEVVAIVGPSGCGKSTLLYCLAGLLRPDQGTVRFEGRDLAKSSDAARSELRRSRFGFVFQFAELVPELTLRENIALPLELNGVRGSQRRRRVGELLDLLDLSAAADRRPAKVSGGQAQRAAVARALAIQPQVVFADEPTGALDSVNGRAVLEALVRLARDEGSSVLLVTHDAEIAKTADRLVLMRDGGVLPGGTT